MTWGVNKTFAESSKYSAKDRFVIGILASIGVSLAEAQRIFGVSRSYYYELAAPSKRLLSMFFPSGDEIIGFLIVTKGVH